MRYLITVVIVLSALITSPVSAELKSTSPSAVCVCVKDLGLATRGWINLYENVFGCGSDYKELGFGSPLLNNLAFYAYGDGGTVKKVELVLNVNNRAQAASAHKELLETAEVLSRKVAGEQLPKSLKVAITDGKNATAKIGSASVKVVREHWPSGRGYEVKVIIK